jgi:uncharacterized protein YdaU (DUF1376 family)
MKAPAFQFYPTDYIASQRVQMLTLEEEGAYIRLLCYCWQHGSIPSDIDQLTRLIGKGGSTTVARVVAAMFQPSADGERLLHDRLEQERTKQQLWREKSAEGGRKSSDKRKGGSTTLQPPHQPKGNIPSPSPSPTPVITNKEETAEKPSALFPSLPFESLDFIQSWANFRTHRKQIRKPLTPMAETMQLKQLAEIGEQRAIRAIEHTIAKGWQGIREPDGKSPSGTPQINLDIAADSVRSKHW